MTVMCNEQATLISHITIFMGVEMKKKMILYMYRCTIFFPNKKKKRRKSGLEKLIFRTE